VRSSTRVALSTYCGGLSTQPGPAMAAAFCLSGGLLGSVSDTGYVGGAGRWAVRLRGLGGALPHEHHARTTRRSSSCAAARRSRRWASAAIAAAATRSHPGERFATGAPPWLTMSRRSGRRRSSDLIEIHRPPSPGARSARSETGWTFMIGSALVAAPQLLAVGTVRIVATERTSPWSTRSTSRTAAA